MTGFRHDTLAQRILFGAGRAPELLAIEIRERGAQRVMLIGSDRVAHGALVDGLPVAARIEKVRQHVPAADADAGRALARTTDADLLISVGGGSATGLAKAIALETGLPIVAVPTTYAGSEATAMWGITAGNHKTTGVDLRVLPAAIVYDSDLFASLPPPLAVSSGLNALAHAIDALWAPGAEPLAAANAEISIRMLGDSLPMLTRPAPTASDRDAMLVGAYLAAVAFNATGSGIHHKICHLLGGRFGLPHAELHAAVLPEVLRYNAPFAPETTATIARALGAADGVAGVESLYRALEAPRALKDLGLREDDLDEAAELSLAAIPESNPRPPDLASIRELLQRAWSGTA
jgi:maleylacetate reductase